MSKFLDDFFLTMPDIQAEQLKAIYNKEAAGLGILDKAGLEEALSRLKEQIKKSKDFSFQGQHQVKKVDSTIHNSNMEEIDLDLKVLFNLSASIDEYMRDHLNLTQSGLQMIERKVYEIKQRMNQIRMILNKDISYDEVVYETFESPNYIENNLDELLTYATDRFNSAVPKEQYAEHIGNTIVLASVGTEDQVKTNYGRKLADIKVRSKTGYSSVIEGHEIDKAFDSSLDTYWAENILVDEPVEETELENWTIQSKYDGITGALCEIEIRLDAVSSVSDIHFNPFCSYPIEIIDVTGFENRDFGGTTHSLIARDHENPSQVSQRSNKQMILRFPSVDIGSLRITIRQENFTKENYIVKTKEVQNAKMWNSLSSNEELLEDTKLQNETMAEFNKKLEISGWSTYVDALKNWANEAKENGIIPLVNTALQKIKTGNYKNGLTLELQELESATAPVPENLKESWTAADKVSYVYGAYNIAVFGRKYESSSVFITKALPLSSNAKMINITTEETHAIRYNQEDGHKVQLTDIEYSITAKKNPSMNEWISILPFGQTMVSNELLLGDSIGGNYPELKANGRSIEFSLRFETTSKDSVEIKRNGKAMSSDQYIVSDDMKKVAILGKYFSPSSEYTITYRPVDKAYKFDTEIDLDMQPTLYTNEQGQVGEQFSDVLYGSQLTLKNKPYLSREFLFEKKRNEEQYKQKSNALDTGAIEFPIQIWANEKYLKNVTDYDSNTYDPERLKENDGYSFAQIGNTVVLGVPIDKKGSYPKLRVDYHYIINNIRLKAILRRTTFESNSVTPELLNYTIQCTNKDQEV